MHQLGHDRLRGPAQSLSRRLPLRPEATAAIRPPRLAKESHGDLPVQRLWPPANGAMVSKSLAGDWKETRHGQKLRAIQEAGSCAPRAHRPGHRPHTSQELHRCDCESAQGTIEEAPQVLMTQEMAR